MVSAGRPVRVSDGAHWAYGLRGRAVRPRGRAKLRVSIQGVADSIGRKRTIAILNLERWQVAPLKEADE